MTGALTLRTRLLIVFVVVGLPAAGIWWLTQTRIASNLAVASRDIDTDLAAIARSRRIAADFAELEQTTPDGAALDAFRAALEADLDDAARDASLTVRDAAEAARDAFARWMQNYAAAPRGGTPALTDAAARTRAAIDTLADRITQDALRRRREAVETTRWLTLLNLTSIGCAFLLGGAGVLIVCRWQRRRIAEAAAAATAIAGGRLSTPIPQGGTDEFGRLLAAMTAMRDSIRGMMAREIAQRRSAQMRLVDAMEGSNEGILLFDAAGGLLLANRQARSFLAGMEAQLQPGMRFADLVAAASARGLDLRAEETRLASGRWMRIARSPTREGGTVAILSDITALKRREAELQETNFRLDAALGNMAQGLCLFGADRRLLTANRRFAEILGVDPDALPPGLPLEDLERLAQSCGAPSELIHGDLDQDILAFAAGEGPILRQHQTRDGRTIAVARKPMRGGGWLATYEDVTDHRRAEARIAYLARHDSLTGLPNRGEFLARLEQAIALLGRDMGSAVFCLDINQFKAINDTFGHHAGDRLLREAADRIAACVRETDAVARLDSDEFAILQMGVERPEDAEAFARRLGAVLSEPFDIDGSAVEISACIGVALAGADGAHPDVLLKHADLALQRAKADGRGAWRFFEIGMDARLQERRALEAELRRAVIAGVLELHYQPLVEIRHGRTVGFEALLRWPHPERGMIAPSIFIPLAEEMGLITQIGEGAIRRATQEAAEWPDGLKVAVNVSPAQFRSPRLVSAVAEALEASGLPATRLELEITESVLLHDNEATLDTLHQLKGLGVRISLDDFGTGYSSLSYLRSFPFDKIKIDQSFVRDLPTKSGSRAIVRAVSSLGQSLGMSTTAEGVESVEQLERLAAEGCVEAQGYLFSPPVPAAEISAVIERINTRWRLLVC